VRINNLKIILSSPSLWLYLTTIKRRRDWRKLFHGGDIISALMPPSGNKRSSCRHVDEDADVEVVVLIGAATEKPIPPLSFTVAKEENEKIKLQYQKI